MDEGLWRFAHLVAPSLSKIQTKEELLFSLSQTGINDPNIEWFDKTGHKIASKGEFSTNQLPKAGFRTFNEEFDKIRSFTLFISINRKRISETPT